jgi:predicted Zn-dependent protease
MMTIARDHYRKRRLDLALYTLKAILDGFGDENPARDRNSAEARLIRGLILKEQNNKKGAMEDFKLAVSLRPDLVEARIQLASYLLESGAAAEAANLLEGAPSTTRPTSWLTQSGDAHEFSVAAETQEGAGGRAEGQPLRRSTITWACSTCSATTFRVSHYSPSTRP